MKLPRAATIFPILLLALSVLVMLPRPWRVADPRDGPVRARLDSLRVATAECVLALDDRRAELDAFHEKLDSLRSAVAAFESPDRTVPAADFVAYLEAFDAYNTAVDDWNDLADALRGGWAACRELADTHNRIADSAAAALRSEP